MDREQEKSGVCFLDGRYIAPALASVPEFIPEPITIDIVFDAKGELIVQSIRSDFFQLQPGMNIVRVVVRSSYMRHSALLWINTDEQTAVYTDCVGAERGRYVDDSDLAAKVHPVVDDLLKQYTSVFGYALVVDRIRVPKLPVLEECEQAGFCNAYVIKQVWDWQDGVEFDPTSFDVIALARNIERDFADDIDLSKPVEVEYYHGGRGWGGRGGWGRGGRGWGGGAGLGLGLLGGLAIGGLAASAARPAYYPYYPTPYYPYPYPYYY